jgi:hypothetical protein
VTVPDAYRVVADYHQFVLRDAESESADWRLPSDNVLVRGEGDGVVVVAGAGDPPYRLAVMRTTAVVVVVCSILVAAGCTGSGRSAQHVGVPGHVPKEFRHACGHPGTHVKVSHLPVVVRHADCDLIGVRVTYRNYGGTTIGADPGGVGTSSGLQIEVAAHTLDVSIRAPKGGPGNA